MKTSTIASVFWNLVMAVLYGPWALDWLDFMGLKKSRLKIS